MDQPSPKEVFRSFVGLSAEEKASFLKELAFVASAELILWLISHIRSEEKERFKQLVIQSLPPINAPDTFEDDDDEPLPPEVEELFRQNAAGLNVAWRESLDRELAKYKAKRDRKSDPETIRRNVEICDLWNQDRATWSQGKLAKRHGMTPRAVRKILSEEAKWRRLSDNLRTN